MFLQRLRGTLIRLELDKLNLFEVMDRYDMEYLVKKNNISLENCYGKICLTEVGGLLGTDNMLTGSIEKLGEKIVISARLIDVKKAAVTASIVEEFLPIPEKLQNMIGLTLMQLFNVEIDKDILGKLTESDDFENSLNFSDRNQLELDGPRMGVTIFSGETADVYRSPTLEGSFDALPVMFQFGYQFEVAYLTEGNFQGLFEFVPVITGLDQGKIIPSVSFLNGIRDSKLGIEIAFRPILFLNKEKRGYDDPEDDNKWKLEQDYVSEEGLENPDAIIKRLDSRGYVRIGSSFIIAVGKTFKSGRLNIPINLFMIPNKEGHRYGLSFGFNASKHRRR
ncbi:MAG: hypothetical protein ACI85O_002507 [Saprospiraceae bacterium]|jgi:hypothetical protein